MINGVILAGSPLLLYLSNVEYQVSWQPFVDAMWKDCPGTAVYMRLFLVERKHRGVFYYQPVPPSRASPYATNRPRVNSTGPRCSGLLSMFTSGIFFV